MHEVFFHGKHFADMIYFICMGFVANKAYDMDKGNLYLGTKLVNAMLKSKDIRQHEWAFYVVMQIGQLVPTNTTQEGGYYVLLAKSLFANIY